MRMRVERIITFIGCSVLSLLTIIIILQVIFRYVLQMPLAWSEEVSRYMMVWLVYLGSILAMMSHSHVRTNLLTNFLRDKIIGRKYINILEKIFSILYMLIIIYSGWLVIPITIFQRTPILKIPMGIVYLIIPLSAASMALFMGIELIFSIRNFGSKN
ncbi:hypothetical protein ES705_21007 [subsurface metagenome]